MLPYNPNSPNLVINDRNEVVGVVTHWNPCGLGEVIVQYFDGSADSAFFLDLNFANGPELARYYLDKKER